MQNKTTISIEHELTDDDIIRFSKELAQYIREFGDVQMAKKAALSGFKTTSEELNKKIQDISGKIMRGFYWEEHLVAVEDDLETNIRYYKDPESGVTLKSEPIDNEQPTIFEKQEVSEDVEIDDDDDSSDQFPAILPETVSAEVE